MVSNWPNRSLLFCFLQFTLSGLFFFLTDVNLSYFLIPLRPRRAGLHTAGWCFTAVFSTQIWCKERTDPHVLPLKILKLCPLQTPATGSARSGWNCPNAAGMCFIASIYTQDNIYTLASGLASTLQTFSSICHRSGSCPRQRGSGSKKKQRCSKRCSTPILCDFTTFGSRRWRGRSVLFWSRSSWPQAR